MKVYLQCDFPDCDEPAYGHSFMHADAVGSPDWRLEGFEGNVLRAPEKKPLRGCVQD